jgi:two-component system, NtrC family, response regulator AtoC
VVRATAICDGTIRAKDLPERVQKYLVKESIAASPGDLVVDPAAEEYSTLSEIEGRHVTKVLRYTGGNKQAASRVLDVDRKTLDRMIKRHGIAVDKRV